jgi:hypothetical protein
MRLNKAIGRAIMDRAEFLKSIDRNGTEFTDMIVGFFDQHMLLYDLVDNVSNVSIIELKQNNVEFKVDFPSTNDVDIVMNRVTNAPIIPIYEKNYNVQCALCEGDSSINVIIRG